MHLTHCFSFNMQQPMMPIGKQKTATAIAEDMMVTTFTVVMMMIIIVMVMMARLLISWAGTIGTCCRIIVLDPTSTVGAVVPCKHHHHNLLSYHVSLCHMSLSLCHISIVIIIYHNNISIIITMITLYII